MGLKEWGFELQIVPPDVVSKALKRGTSKMAKVDNKLRNFKIEDGKILKRVTKEMLKDPDEPGIHPLEAAMRRLDAKFFEEGMPLYRSVGYTKDKPEYHASFVPRKRQTKEPDEN